MRRVVVTGLGAVTPIGLNTDDFWDAIKKNTVGIDTITSSTLFPYTTLFRS